MQDQQTKINPESQRERGTQESQLVNAYVSQQRQRNRTSIDHDAATEWFNGATTVLAHPSNFGINTPPAKDIPTVREFIDLCTESIRKAA